METQSALKKAIWLLAGSVVMLMAVLVIGNTILIVYAQEKSERLKALDYNVEMPRVPVTDISQFHSNRPYKTTSPQLNKDALNNWPDEHFLGQP